MSRRTPFYDRAPEFTDTVYSLTRLVNSTNGNPRYRVTFTDDTTRSYNTMPDASFDFGIENRDMRGQVGVWLMPSGRIEHMEPHK